MEIGIFFVVVCGLGFVVGAVFVLAFWEKLKGK